ncbi:MAG: 4Fe-4S dicluster domain-containing protein [Promethearchaeota archaeon]
MLELDINLCKGCGYCIDECPKGVLDFDDEPSPKGYYLCKIVHPEDCIACKRCELICPEMAIYLVDEPNSDKENTTEKIYARENKVSEAITQKIK